MQISEEEYGRAMRELCRQEGKYGALPPSRRKPGQKCAPGGEEDPVNAARRKVVLDLIDEGLRPFEMADRLGVERSVILTDIRFLRLKGKTTAKYGRGKQFEPPRSVSLKGMEDHSSGQERNP